MRSYKCAWLGAIFGAPLFVLSALALGVWLGNSHSPDHPTNVIEVEKRIQAAIPLGSSRGQVEEWLDSQQFEHGYAQSNWIHELPTPMQAGLQEEDYEGAVRAIIRDTDRSFLIQGNICMKFLFNHQKRYVKRLVFYVGTGP